MTKSCNSTSLCNAIRVKGVGGAGGVEERAMNRGYFWKIVPSVFRWPLQKESEGMSFEELVLLDPIFRGLSSPISLMAQPRDEYLTVLVNVVHTISSHILPCPYVLAYNIQSN
jgi:hypothetical protein